MAICGGAIGGYWETGSFLTASRPVSITIMAITQAKIGRLMKKRGIIKLLRADPVVWPDRTGRSDYFFAAAGCAAAPGAASAGLLPNGTLFTTVPGRAL